MIIVVDDEDAIMVVIDRDPAWMIELAWSVSSLAERGHEREAFVVVIITREYLHSMIVAISNHQETSMMIERQASRFIEQAIVVALLDGANRAHDSSIDIIMVRLVEMVAHDCITRTAATKISTSKRTILTRPRMRCWFVVGVDSQALGVLACAREQVTMHMPIPFA